MSDSIMNRTQGRKGRRAIICLVFIVTYLAINSPRDSGIEVKAPTNSIATNSTTQYGLSDIVGKADTWTKGWDWDQHPYVIESHKLVFYSIPKVSTTIFKQLFRRMEGYENWKTRDSLITHDPRINGLKRLRRKDFSPENIATMLISPEWTRAIFIRDPKERFLSAYLDKVQNKEGKYVIGHCCPKKKQCVPNTMLEFIELSKRCHDPHWAPQNERLEHWDDLINYVGTFNNIQNDTRRLLQRIDAWEEFGSKGWGINGTEQIFGATKTSHATGSEKLYESYYTKDIERLVEERYREDYMNDVIVNALDSDTTM